MASMAALLMVVAWNMSEIDHFLHTVHVAPKSDTAVLLICFSLTIMFDMVIAVSVGVLLGALFFIRRMASLTEGNFVNPLHTKAKKYSLPKEVVLYSINGPLFFGAAERAIGALRSIGKDIKVIIFLLNDVMAADMTGLVAMEGVIQELKLHGVKAIIVGAHENVKNLFYRGGLKPVEGVIAYADNVEEAIAMFEGNLEKYHRRHAGPIRIQHLHRQRHGASRKNIYE
jgi:SulP family sulfate permease